MSHSEQVTKIYRLLETAETSLASARELLKKVEPGISSSPARAHVNTEDARVVSEGETQIIEGTFDGQNMIGPNQKIFPVPANYASKSKLVEGDRLKLTIMHNGSFVFKQISPIDREFVKGALIKEDGQFKVAANGKSYRVLLASVTYYKGDVGDEVTLVVPKDSEAVWGAIEAVIPSLEGQYKEEGF